MMIFLRNPPGKAEKQVTCWVNFTLDIYNNVSAIDGLLIGLIMT